MKLAEALRTIHQAPSEPITTRPPSTLSLACGFEPLHFATFLQAHCRLARPDRAVTLQKGLYGDLAGNLERCAAQQAEYIALAIEWSDLDPRLGLRMPAVWNRETLEDIPKETARRLARLQRALENLPPSVIVVASAPTLPFPPVGFAAPWLANPLELDLEEQVAVFLRRTRERGVKWISANALQAVSPSTNRYDGKSDFASGFPYSLTHADKLAELFSKLFFPPAQKKGLITDLDNTLWQGVVGDIGPEGVSWDLDHKTRAHGLYQQLLRSLAESGVLVAVASKNDPKVVEAAFQRDDLLLRAEHVFPMEVHWGPKSASVERIAKAWNIGLDSVVFVDDSALEREEVARAHPQLQCLEFPADSSGPVEVEALCWKLRELFGRERVSDEDRLRLSSIRQNQNWQAAAGGGETDEDFLAGLNARLVFDQRKSPPDPRALELLNKTNQFNLNGRRVDVGEWRRFFEKDDTFCWLVSYEDRLGPLGRIAVLAGTQAGNEITVQHWVMSCRAFSRRIEHACLRQLFARAATVHLNYAATPRNGPTQEFLQPWLNNVADGSVVISLDEMERHCKAVHHSILEKPEETALEQVTEAPQELLK